MGRGVVAQPAAPPARQVSADVLAIGDVQLDRAKRTVSFGGEVNMNQGQLEYVIVGMRGKLHESLFRTTAQAYHIHAAMLLLGVRDQTQRTNEPATPQALRGEPVSLWAVWRGPGGEEKVRVEDWVRNDQTGQVMERGSWIYNGSRFVEGLFIAQREQSIVAIQDDVDALINNPRPGRENDKIWPANEKAVPKVGTPVTLIIQLESKPAPPVASEKKKP